MRKRLRRKKSADFYDELDLSERQAQQMAKIELTHAQRREMLAAQMRAANADLARAFQEQHRYTANTQAAIDRLLQATGELQKETILHVIAMGALLTPEQAARFDAAVVNALTREDS